MGGCCARWENMFASYPCVEILTFVFKIGIHQRKIPLVYYIISNKSSFLHWEESK
ncbi:hypothetical protein CXB51_035394 [Gossypium anomalum]|uniref:Uncharacterized protein n=1 Tax=Gossypium anomalum TaxID=47600 RepID=A0A8J5XMS1_9ROSI|nr:hypothetical protein CXB51_035394 [Gossypium anomalum]